jgi:enediyne biosynthesis protein E4
VPRIANQLWLRPVLLLAILACVIAFWFTRNQKPRTAAPVPTNALQILTAFEEQSARQYWQPELDAQQRLRTITTLWDAINHSTNKLATALANFSPAELILPTYNNSTELPHHIRIFKPANATQSSSSLNSQPSTLNSLTNGWTLDQCEFRFIAINPDTFYVSLHLTNPQTQTRAIFEGNVTVQFSPSNTLHRVDASRLELRTRTGPPAFAEMFHAQVPPPPGSYLIDPLIIWDLNLDSELEVLLPGANVLIRRTPQGTFTPDRLITHEPGPILTAILGDFTGNGTTDLLTANFDGLNLFEGAAAPQPTGPFPDPPRRAWSATPRLRYPQALTAGDIDRDGDLDLFLAQYKVPFEKGQMPFPYFDANDGYPSFLLQNDGAGNFTDITARAGLAAKRARRAYSASFIDLDSDSDLDLILTSDFAGLDAFENNAANSNSGENLKFTDATKKWFPETAALGMAHSFADFDRDGLLDFILVGMNSPTADRLRSAKLNRPYDIPDAGRREALTFGNRLYFGTRENSQLRFAQRPVSSQVARTGWSWGSAAADLDHDGFPELYIANGHASRASTHDYESEFWLHDIYIGQSQENSLAETYFRQKLTRARAANHSYGGHERNRLFLNQRGTNFVEIAHLFGLALPEDCRNTAAADLDRDGRLDLIVTTFEEYPEIRQTIRFYRNKLENLGNHTTITLANPLHTGATAQLIQSSPSTLNPQPSTSSNAFTIVSGESYRTQLPPQLHLGLGPATSSHPSTNTFILR